MEEGISLYMIFKDFMHFGSPIVILVGALIILHKNYTRVEDNVNKDVGGIKTRIIPQIESNIFTIHNMLFNIKNLVGILCILFGAFFFFLTR